MYYEKQGTKAYCKDLYALWDWYARPLYNTNEAQFVHPHCAFENGMNK